jgi:hypothetical protein
MLKYNIKSSKSYSAKQMCAFEDDQLPETCSVCKHLKWRGKERKLHVGGESISKAKLKIHKTKVLHNC